MRIMNAKEKTALDKLLRAAQGDSVAVVHAMRKASRKTGSASLRDVMRLVEQSTKEAVAAK